MKELTPKQKFIEEISKKLKNGDWGLEEVNHLEENKIKYHLNYEDIAYFLNVTYNYVYGLALENGEISDLEMANLLTLKNTLSTAIPENKEQRIALKMQITELVKKFQKDQIIEHHLELESNKRELMKQKVKSLYYLPPWLRTPKLTPYNSYYD